MSKPTLAALLVAASALLASFGAHADIFQCVDRAGKTLYTDQPCPSGSRVEDVFTAAKICGSADCLERRERQQEAARERARVEREHMEALMAEQERRMRAEEQAQRLEAELRAREAAIAEAAAPVEPVYVIYGPALLCTGSRCDGRPHKPHHQEHPGAGKPNCIGPACVTRPQPDRDRVSKGDRS